MGFSGDRVQRPPEQLGSPSRSHQNRQFRDGDRRDGAGRAGKNGCEARAVRRDRAAPRRPGPSRAIAPILAGPGIFLVRRAHRPLRVRRAEWAVLRVPGPHQTMHRRHTVVRTSTDPGRGAGGFFAEMCILHSRMTVGTAHSKAKCTFRRGGARETAPTAPTPAPDERWPLSGLQAGDSAREGYSAGDGAGAGETEPAAGSWQRSPAWTT